MAARGLRGVKVLITGRIQPLDGGVNGVGEADRGIYSKFRGVYAAIRGVFRG